MSHRNLGFDFTNDGADGSQRIVSRRINMTLFDPPGGGAIAESDNNAGQQDVEKILVHLAKVLRSNIVRTQTLDPVKHINTPSDDHSGMPAGYTYLYQLAGHDMTVTTIERRPPGGPGLMNVNMRSRPLMLDTLFGGGPMANRLIYDVSPDDGLDTLRLGLLRVGKNDRSEPQHDLPRCPFSHNNLPSHKDKLTEVLIADPRNDDNNLVAQMTVFFSRVYNELVRKSPDLRQHPVAKRHRARVAREATRNIYRRILSDDLTRRMLQPDIWDFYRSGGEPLLGPDDKVVANAFRFSACRLGHVMVRPDYALNIRSKTGKPVKPNLTKIIRTSSLHKHFLLPTRRDWKINWRLFFPTGQDGQPEEAIKDHFNWALRFDPITAAGMETDVAGPQVNDYGVSGVLMLDFLREENSEIESVESLFSKLKGKNPGFENLKKGHDRKWRAKLVDRVLKKLETDYTGPKLGGIARQTLLEQPPLTFYLMCEAQDLAEGKTYGPLGSIIVGEAFRSVFERRRSIDLAESAEELEIHTFGSRINNMPSLVRQLDILEGKFA